MSLSAIFANVQRLALSPTQLPPSTIACTRELSLPSGISTTNLRNMMGSAAEIHTTSVSATYADVVNISSGRGIIQFLAFGGEGSDTNAEITLTIDGVTVINAIATTGFGLRVPIGSVSNVDGTNFRASVSLGYVPYTRSMRLQLRRIAGGSFSASALLKYSPT